MAHVLDSLKTWIVSIMPWGAGGYLTVFVLMVLEAACIPIPSEITMPVAGLLASEHHLSLIPVIAVGILGDLAGALVSYAVGRSGGRSLLLRYGRFVLIKPHDVDRADAWFARYGPPAVFFSRLLPVLRTFISLPAGVAGMDVKRFSLLTIAGSIPWVGALTIAGYELGSNWGRVLTYTRPLTILGAVCLVGGVALWLLRRNKADKATA